MQRDFELSAKMSLSHVNVESAARSHTLTAIVCKLGQ